MLRFAIAFLTGTCCLHLLPSLPAPWPWVAFAVIPVIVAMLLRSAWPVALLLGFVWAWFGASSRLQDDLPAMLEGVDLVVRGAVASLPEATGTDPQFDFDVIEADAGVPPRIRLSWYDTNQRPAAGETWQLLVRLKRRNGFANPGGHDYEAQLFRHGIGATGYIRNDELNQRLRAATGYPVLRARAWLADRIQLAAGNDPVLGILQGLAVGETQAMTADQWRVFAATGTTHLMAISGMHITMIAALAAWVGGLVVRLPPAQRWRVTKIHGQVACGMLAALGYSLLAGMSIPTQRTLVMLCVAFGAKLLRREWGVGRTLAVAILAILLVDPFAPMTPGAWLSFGAVAVILIATSGSRVREGVAWNFTRVQIAVTAGLVPVIVAAFGSLSAISPITNTVAVPLFTLLVVPLVLAGTLLACVWLPAGECVLGVAAKLLNGIWPAFEYAASLPFAMWHVPSLPWLVQTMLVVGALACVLPGIAAMRVAAAMMCLPAFLWRPVVPEGGEFRLTLVDVGQGLATVVRTRTRVLVFDAGPSFRSGRDTGEMVVLPYLRSEGVRRIDTMMVSHGDLDHDGGLTSVLKGMPVARLLVGPSVRRSTMHTDRCEAGQRWEWDRVAFEVLHPSGVVLESDNESSCVLRISGVGGSALLTGDIQREAETVLVASGVAQTDIVVVPHHGSRTSSTEAFVQATKPAIALVAAGYRNRWGFPKPDVVGRWRSAGASVLSTQESGAITVDVTLDGVQPPRQFRAEFPRYWRSRQPEATLRHDSSQP